jgi:hypothetical protein
MARAPPTWRLVLNTPLATPAWWPGMLSSRTAVTGGMTSGPASPVSTISPASVQTGAEGGRKAAPVTRGDRPRGPRR